MENQSLSFWDINNTELITKHKNIFDFEEIFFAIVRKIKEFITKKNSIAFYFIDKVEEERDGAVDYYNKIPVPCYLNLIIKRLENLYYYNFESLIFDFNLIKENTIKYNSKDNPILDCCEKLYTGLLGILEDIFKTFKFNPDIITENKINGIDKKQKISNNKICNRNIENFLKEENEIVNDYNSNTNLKPNPDSDSEIEYNSNNFDFKQNNLLETENYIKPKGKRGRKKKVNTDENENLSILGKVMNSVEINNCDENNVNNNLNENNSEFSYSKKNLRITRERNTISIPIVQVEKNEHSGRNTRHRKNIKYNENDLNISMDSDSQDSSKHKMKNKMKIKKNTIKDENFSEDDLDENVLEENYDIKRLGRKRNRQIIKFQLK